MMDKSIYLRVEVSMQVIVGKDRIKVHWTEKNIFYLLGWIE